MTSPEIPYNNYSVLFKSSLFSCIPFITALYRKKYYYAIAPGMVMLTSLNYWYYPTNGMRKKLDMYTVRALLIYQSYLSFYSKYKHIYLVSTTTGIMSYCIGIYYYTKGDLWKYTFCHACLHFLANVGNMALCL